MDLTNISEASVAPEMQYSQRQEATMTSKSASTRRRSFETESVDKLQLQSKSQPHRFSRQIVVKDANSRSRQDEKRFLARREFTLSLGTTTPSFAEATPTNRMRQDLAAATVDVPSSPPPTNPGEGVTASMNAEVLLRRPRTLRWGKEHPHSAAWRVVLRVGSCARRPRAAW